MDWNSIVAIVGLIFAGLTVWYMHKQTNIFDRQTAMIDKQTQIFEIQNKIYENQIKLELYEKRFLIYQRTLNFLYDIIAHANMSDDAFFAFKRDTHPAQFLFADDVCSYLKNELQENGFKLRETDNIMRETRGNDAGRYGAATTEHHRLSIWFGEQSEVIKRLFMPYLAFKDISK